MNVKSVKRMCSVKGCRNTETYAISKIKEFGGVIICKSCLEEALKAVNNPKQSKEKAVCKEERPLFYHPEMAKKENVQQNKADNTEKDTNDNGRSAQPNNIEKSVKEVKVRTSTASKRK